MEIFQLILVSTSVFYLGTAFPTDSYQLNLKNYDDVRLIRVFTKYDGSVDKFIDKLVKDGEVVEIRADLKSRDILVIPKNVYWIKRDLENKKIDYKEVIRDVGSAIREEAGIAPYSERPQVNWDWWSSSWAQWWRNFGWREQNPKMVDFPLHKGHATYRHNDFITWDSYYDFDDFNKYYNFLREVYSSVVTAQLAGYSYEGRPISIMKISSGQPNATKIWIDGGTKGNDWISTSVATFIMKELVENRQAHGDNIKNVDFYIAPIINPDGYVYSRYYDRFWSKNRKKFENERCLGVDLSHNWNSNWDGNGLLENVCSWNYPGPFPFSEPETRAVSEFLVENAKDMEVFISFKANGQFIEYPFGYTSKRPEDMDELTKVADMAIEAVQEAGGPKYKVSSMNENSGISNGNMLDWIKGSLGVKYSYVIHLRDNDSGWPMTQPKDILLTAIDGLQIVKSIVDYIAG